MIYITGFAIFIYILLLGGFIALAFAEATLVKRKKKKSALAIILVVFILMTASSISLSYVHTSGSSSGGVPIWTDNNKTIGELTIVSDSQNNVLGFGMLKLDSGDTPKYLKLVYNDDGKLIGEEEAIQYEKDISASLNDTPWKKLSGESMNQSELDRISNKEETNFEPNTFAKAFLINNIYTVILILIYIIFTRRNTLLKQKKLDNIKIQDL